MWKEEITKLYVNNNKKNLSKISGDARVLGKQWKLRGSVKWEELRKTRGKA